MANPVRYPCSIVLFAIITTSPHSCNNMRRASAEKKNITDQQHQPGIDSTQTTAANRNGAVYTFYPGTHDTALVTGYLDGEKNGLWKKFYPNGQVKEQRLFDKGIKTGEYTAWWKNGNKQLDYFFENDEYEGTCREWNEAGVLIKEMNYRKGYEEGPQKMFYDNGKVRSNYTIINGRRYGLLGTKNCVNVSDSIF